MPDEARFTAEIVLGGQFVRTLMPALDAPRCGAAHARQAYEHNYPFCWRCDTPLTHYAKSSWYARTTARKDEVLAPTRGHLVPITSSTAV